MAFNAGLDTGGQGIFVYDGETREIANSDGEFDQFSSPDINDEGAIAFLAQRDDGSHGIYTNTYGEIKTLVDDKYLGKFICIFFAQVLNNYLGVQKMALAE